LSLEGRELKGKSSILCRHGRMTAEEESRKTEQEQGEGRHRPRFLDHDADESQAAIGEPNIGEPQAYSNITAAPHEYFYHKGMRADYRLPFPWPPFSGKI
jgi:hypothetical protein